MPHLTMNNPNTRPTRVFHVRVIQTILTRGTHPGEGWQTGFTILPIILGNFRHLLVPVDTFSGWTIAFPARTEMAAVAKVLLKAPGLGSQDPHKAITVQRYQVMKQISVPGIK